MAIAGGGGPSNCHQPSLFVALPAAANHAACCSSPPLPLLQDKARLLVTHQLQYLPGAHHIVLLDNGRVEVQGSYEECLANESFARLLAEHNTQAGGEVQGEQEQAEEEARRKSLDEVLAAEFEKEKQQRREEEEGNEEDKEKHLVRADTKVCGWLWVCGCVWVWGVGCLGVCEGALRAAG